MSTIKVFHDNGRGTRVTERSFNTLLRDQDISVITSVQIGFEPLCYAGVTGIAFALFAFRFGDLFYNSERMAFLALSAIVLAAGCSLATLKISTLFQEKTIWCSTIWTVFKVRRAIDQARHVSDNRLKFAPRRKPE